MRISILLFISVIFIISCKEKKNDLNTKKSKEELAIDLVNKTLRVNSKEQNVDLFLEGESISYINSFPDTKIEEITQTIIKYDNLLKNTNDTLEINELNLILSQLEKSLIFYKTFEGYEIIKNFHVKEKISPMIRQIFYVDTALVLRAASYSWSTKMIIDTIDGKLEYSYVDTLEYWRMKHYWND